MKEIKKNSVAQKKKLKKIGKLAVKIILGVLLYCLGLFGIPGYVIADPLAAFMPQEVAVLISIIVKTCLVGFGGISAFFNLKNIFKTKDEIEDIIDENEVIVETLEDELTKEKEKNNELQTRLTKESNNVIKRTYENNELERDTKEEENNLVKRKIK